MTGLPQLPSFSVIIPTYQRRDMVCDTVRALCSVEYRGPLELVVVIDGSNDGTEAALAGIPCPFPTKFVHQENKGVGGARNRGAVEAAGDVLLFLDDDMVAAPDLVEQHASVLLAGADAVIGHIPLHPDSAPGFLSAGVGRWADEQAERLRRGEALTLFDCMCGQLSVRRSVFEELGGFDGSFTSGGGYGDEDLDFLLRLSKRHRLRFNPHAISHQRYVVEPRQHLLQWSRAGRADVSFARKHPERAAELFALHGEKRWSTRLLFRPLAAVPFAARATAGAAAWLAEREERVPRSLRPVIARLFYAARDIGYWSGVRAAGG